MNLKEIIGFNYYRFLLRLDAIGMEQAALVQHYFYLKKQEDTISNHFASYKEDHK